MSDAFINLLQRQLKRHFGHLDNVPADLLPFLRAVNESYLHYENDRKLMDRANELSSQELFENNRALSRKNEMLDAFVYRVSHDLKTPINNLLSLSEMLTELDPACIAADPTLLRTVAAIGETAERMNTRINDLLDLSRMERALDAVDETLSFVELMQHVMQDLTVEIQKADAVVHCDFEGAPSISFGRENLYSLLSNLLSNAIKYRAQSRPPVIHVCTAIVDTHILLTISDNGMGFDLEKHSGKIFGMFNRFHSHVPGTGVGLFIVKKIVEKSGGKIHVESTLDTGTTFYIRFTNARTTEEAQLHPAR